MQLNFAELNQNQRYHLMTQTIVPRPIAWVLTQNEEGAQEGSGFNLAPFSFFNAVSAEPAIVMLGFTHKSDGSAKDTWHNLLHSKQCTIHLASLEQLDALVQTSAELDYGTSEVDANKLKLAEFAPHTLPRLAKAPVALGCTLHSYQTFGEKENSGVVFCEIHHVHIDDQISHKTAEGRIIVDATKYMPPARLGGLNYATMYKVEEKQRP